MSDPLTSKELLLQRLRSWPCGEIGIQAAAEIELLRDLATNLESSRDWWKRRALAGASEPPTDHAPIIAVIRVGEKSSELLYLYGAHGLPPGKYDLYLKPSETETRSLGEFWASVEGDTGEIRTRPDDGDPYIFKTLGPYENPGITYVRVRVMQISEPPADNFESWRDATAAKVADEITPALTIRALFNKGVGVQKGNRFSFSFETEEEANLAFHYIADLGTLETSQPPHTTETKGDSNG